MWRRKQQERAKRGFPRVHIVHDATGWGAEDHAALRDYYLAHALLPEHPGTVPVEEIVDISLRLSREGISAEESKRLLMLLAHHRSEAARAALQVYLRRPHRGLERFAKLALDEATQWRRFSGRCLGPNDPCACRCGQKFKACCGAGLA